MLQPNRKLRSMTNPKVVIPLFVVLALSFGAAWLLPVNEMFKGIAAVPGIGVLLSVLFQLIRDEAAHAKQVEIQQQQQIFSLGAMSHMANVAFDKHVLFCEKYMNEVHEVVSTLFREGPTEAALSHAAQLAGIRREFAAWVTESINKQLEPFERALRRLGADQGFVKSTQGQPDSAEQRPARIQAVWKSFNDILTIGGEPPDENVAIEAVKSRIREILAINELVGLRQAFIRNARATLTALTESTRNNPAIG
jgi:hypothetical protein